MFKKIILQFIIISSLIISIYPNLSYAGVVKIEGGDIKTVSINPKSGGLIKSINTAGFSIFGSIKTILLGIFIFYMVYAGAKMIMSMGTDEEQIKSAKRQIRYSLIGIIFINIPGTIYDAFFNNSKKDLTNTNNWATDGIGTIVGSGFGVFLNYIVGLLEILIFFIALFMFIFTGIKLILGGKDSKTVSEAKNKLLYSIVALILVGFIEVWKGFAFSGNITDGVGIFSTIGNLILFIAPLVGLFYLTLAGYYYITSGGDKEKVKKAKDIIIYIFLGTLIFLASYTILLEINTFTV